jgi:hypothetical protein
MLKAALRAPAAQGCAAPPPLPLPAPLEHAASPASALLAATWSPHTVAKMATAKRAVELKTASKAGGPFGVQAEVNMELKARLPRNSIGT